MILFGFIIAFTKKKSLKIGWLILFFIVGTVGLYDFYNWEYDYGHNLNPHAIIKIPGMSYQPPLIGAKQLLNFNAASLPGIGFYIVLISIILVVLSIKCQMKYEKSLVK